MKRTVCYFALGLLTIACAAQAQAQVQDYPYRPIRIIAPNPPGGGFDFIARVVSQKLSDQLGQQVVV